MLETLRKLFYCAMALLPPTLASAQDASPAGAEPPSNLNPPTREASPDLLASMVKQLSAENRVKFGEMLAADWKDRPEWAEMLIALLRQDELRPPLGWYQPSEMKLSFDWLVTKFDSNSDGIVDKSELPKETPDLDRVYSRLDRDADGKLQRSDFDYAGGRQATVPQMASQFLFSRLDSDSDGRVTAEELNGFFSHADREKTNFLTMEDLFLDFTEEIATRNSIGSDMPGPEQMLAMFFRGELGLWEPGPKLGQEAPDFTLPTHDGGRTVTLSQCRGKPVILIFGSFT